MGSTSSSIQSMSSLELASYQESIESVLAWLLHADETLSQQPSVAADVNTVKTQFHKHEVCAQLCRILHFGLTHWDLVMHHGTHDNYYNHKKSNNVNCFKILMRQILYVGSKDHFSIKIGNHTVKMFYLSNVNLYTWKDGLPMETGTRCSLFTLFVYLMWKMEICPNKQAGQSSIFHLFVCLWPLIPMLCYVDCLVQV